MKNAFRGYYSPTKEELEKIWSHGLIILDTNALLNLFRYSKNAREDFFKALRAKKNELWIPQQVGLEFHRRRIEIINHQTKAFDEIEDALTRAKNRAEGTLNEYKRHPSLDIEPLRGELVSSIDSLITKVKASAESHRDAVVTRRTNEDILRSITRLYEGRVGPAFDEDTLTATYDEGAGRYEKRIPPGFADRDKAEPGRYGDLVLWKQILVHASEVNLPAIFVTNDQKDDWWYTVDSERHGARPELVEEYFSATGQRVHFMTSDRFLDFAKSQMVDISEESVNEAERFTRESARSASALLTQEREKRQRQRQDMFHRIGTRHDSKDQALSFTERQKQLLDRELALQRADRRLRMAEHRFAIASGALHQAVESQAEGGETPQSAELIISAERDVMRAERGLRRARLELGDVVRQSDYSDEFPQTAAEHNNHYSEPHRAFVDRATVGNDIHAADDEIQRVWRFLRDHDDRQNDLSQREFEGD